MKASHHFQIIPEPTIRRLADYLHLLLHLQQEGIDKVSSTTIANDLNTDPTQVRKDIQYTSIVGKPKTGFDVPGLIGAIEECLSWNDTNAAFLVGVGSLGKAILGYEGFQKYGLQFIDAFDVDPDIIGKKMYGIEVHHLDEMPGLVNKLKRKIGVLTVPAESAQEVTDKMVEAGIRAIWNFAPLQLKTPEDVIVENIQFSQSLAVLTRKLSLLEFRTS